MRWKKGSEGGGRGCFSDRPIILSETNSSFGSMEGKVVDVPQEEKKKTREEK
jgi:hypothetical protein